MTAARVLILQGHPDQEDHLCHGLAAAYGAGARLAGHEVRELRIAEIPFQLLRAPSSWERGPVPPALLEAQRAIAWSTHIAIFYPLWLGGMPALLKGFLEQVARPGFAFERDGRNRVRKGLEGRSARIVVTMGMPALVYRWYFGAHTLKALERNILRFVGIAPVRHTLVGSVGGMAEARGRRLMDAMWKLGGKAA